MPFISQMDIVDIVDGRHAGKRGMVEKITICAHGSGVVLVWVQVFNLQTGGCDCMQFEPKQLRRAKLRPMNEEFLKAFALAAADEQEQKARENLGDWAKKAA